MIGNIGLDARLRIRRLEFFHGLSTGSPRLSEKRPTPPAGKRPKGYPA